MGVIKLRESRTKIIMTGKSCPVRHLSLRYDSNETVIPLHFTYTGSYTGWIHIYLWDTQGGGTDFIQKFLLYPFGGHTETINIVGTNRIKVYAKHQDDPEPTIEDAQTEISLLAVTEGIVIVSGTVAPFAFALTAEGL